MHLNFVCSLYEEQVREGRFFIHEHPAAATSWEEPAIRRVMRLAEVRVSRVDACQYGMQGEQHGETWPLKKPTRWMSNMRSVNESLSKTCAGQGGMCSTGKPHASCTGKRAEGAAIYPLRLCKAILSGIREHFKQLGWIHDGFVGLMTDAEESWDMAAENGKVHDIMLKEDEENEFKEDVNKLGDKMRVAKAAANRLAVDAGNQRRRGPNAWTARTRDALTRQELDEELVVQGKTAEMEFLKKWQVYEYAEYSEAWTRSGKRPITTKWVCTNKGDDAAPNYRCRWVAREFRDDQDVIFAATAPYESIRLLLSIAAAKEEEMSRKGKVGEQRLQISMIDVNRAYFNAIVDEDTPIYVELPPEDPEHGRKCGRLRRHLYGTRGAAAGWETEYSTFMVQAGFRRGIASGCLFYHPGKYLRVVVYGDDFTVVGTYSDINWFEATMEAKYAITKRGRLGSGKSDEKEMTLLNRVVRWVDGAGLEVEADPRQAERLVAQLGMSGANPVGTPGVKPSVQDLETDENIYDERAKVYQAGAARGNYMGMDRPETQYAVKECCRQMSQPTERALRALKRLGRFVEGHQRLVLSMPFQDQMPVTHDLYVYDKGKVQRAYTR